MSGPGDTPVPCNPFSSRNVRPGAVAYRFPPGQSAAGLVARLEKHGWWGQIVGPHGSGKSALLAALVPSLNEAGKRTVLVELHDRQRRLPVNLRRRKGLTLGTIVLVDGYEQLSRPNRFLLRRYCRRRSIGLVVTAHASAGLPDLCRTASSLETARHVVERLVREYPPLVTPDDVDKPFFRHHGNLREVLFDLYDLYNQRQAQ